MSNKRELSEELLDPITSEQPAGVNLRWLPEWDRVKEARQSEDGLEAGKWAKKDPKSANWGLVEELTTEMLQKRSKDLQLAMWLTEAEVKLRGFAGLRDGLELTRELMVRFWDAGLYPVIEDSVEDRSGPFEWMNDKVVDSVLTIPITCCAAQDRDYSLADLRDARLVGSEAQCKDADGDLDPQKKRELDRALAGGRISLDMFEAAVKDTHRAAYEEVSGEFGEACEEFAKLERVMEEKFGDLAPNLSGFRAAVNEIRPEIATILERKRREEPGATNERKADSADSQLPEPVTVRIPLWSSASQGVQAGAGGSWQQAERLVRSGQVDAGLAEMTRLAASETSGRSRFERKLLLAEVCLGSRRERLARAILGELAEQIDKHQLDSWESSELISGVWSRLYELHKQSGNNSDEAAKLYERLCRLDPWQALACSE